LLLLDMLSYNNYIISKTVCTMGQGEGAAIPLRLAASVMLIAFRHFDNVVVMFFQRFSRILFRGAIKFIFALTTKAKPQPSPSFAAEGFIPAHDMNQQPHPSFAG
jgi:hypothetical protein